MNSDIPISFDLLRDAFSLTEKLLMDEGNNRTITQKITNEVKAVRYEGLLNDMLKAALEDTFEMCSVKKEFKKIDLSVHHGNDIVAAIETKGMVANSHRKDQNRISIDLHGIRTKLYPDKRAANSVHKDIEEISDKIPQGMECPRFEIFVPVIYELYRAGGTDSDWFSERKPWVTLPKFKALRNGMADDLTAWFLREDSRFVLIHFAQSIELRDANQLWIKQSKSRFPKFASLEAYVSFFAFARFIEDV